MITLVLLITFIGLLGLLIFARDPWSPVNKLYLVLCGMVILWDVTSYLTDYSPVDDRLLWGRVTYGFSVLIILFFVLLSRNFPVKIPVKKYQDISFKALAAINFLLGLSPFVVKSAGVDLMNNGTVIVTGSLYYLYLALDMAMLSYAVAAYTPTRYRNPRPYW
jgi:hypothetical protein